MKLYSIVCLAWSLGLTGCAVFRPLPGTELPHVRVAPEFSLPVELRTTNEAVDGEVLIAVRIDEAGGVVDWLVVGETNVRLVPVAEAALRGTVFGPGRILGRSAAAQVGVVFSFAEEAPGVRTTEVEFLGYNVRGGRSRTPLRCFQLDELDGKPGLVREVPPEPRWGVGNVKLQFLIDEEGFVRLPVVVAEDDPDLGRACVEAVTQWRFEVPRREGVPVMALVRKEFRFKR